MSFELNQFGTAASAFSIISTACYLTGSQGIAPAVTFLASTILLVRACQPAKKLYEKGVVYLVQNLFPNEVKRIEDAKIPKMFANLINAVSSVVISVFANAMLVSIGHAALAFFAKEVATQGLSALFLSTVFIGAKVALTTTSVVAVAGLVFYGLVETQQSNREG